MLRSPLQQVKQSLHQYLAAAMLGIWAIVGGAGAIAQTPASPGNNATNDAETPERRPGEVSQMELNRSLLQGLDPQSSLQLWEAINNLNVSLERGLDLPCRFNGADASHLDIEAEGLTQPSLWLPQDLIGGKVVRGWYVYESITLDSDNRGEALPWVELVINEQPWQNLGYLTQYRALETMGRSAYRFGYRLRACNQRQQVIALYICGLEEQGNGPCRALLSGGVSARLNRNVFGF
ncbi:MAG: hypothetical protein ACFCA4_01810 [Cyanophyceae cyanobacterium]